MSRWMKLVFVNPERVRSDEESVHLLFDMTDPAQEGEVRRLGEELAQALVTADEYRASGGHLQVASQNPQGTFPWALAGRCETCGPEKPCERCSTVEDGRGRLSIVPDQV